MTYKPKLIVFDLDYTLWPFWVDSHVTPPFDKDSCGQIRDASGTVIRCYNGVPQLLESLYSKGYIMAVASRTEAPEAAWSLLGLFGWEEYFKYTQIYPGKKTNHFNGFRQASNIPFNEMIFFDDEYRNIEEVGTLGVTCVHVTNGMSKQVLKDGLALFHSEHSLGCHN